MIPSNKLSQLLGFVLVAMMSIVLSACSKNEEKYVEGQHYQRFDNMVADQIAVLPEVKDASVMEFFSYGCMHCKQFAPKLSRWQEKNPYNSIAYIPVIWDEETELYANVFYLVQASPEFKDIHHELFDVVGAFSRTDSLDEKKVALITYLQGKGVQPIEVVNAVNNNAMQVKTAAALMLAKRFEIKGTPNLVVNSQYKIDNRSVKNHEELLDVMSELLNKDG